MSQAATTQRASGVSASQNGYINLLEWWKSSGLEIREDDQWIRPHRIARLVDVERARNELDGNSGCCGHVAVLDWRKSSGLDFVWSKDAMDKASEGGYVEVLDWWKKSGLELKRSSEA
ncbi:hypothetical protein BJ742DRAFT_795377 [Cladochytrium replicatum]|nr:hypothetical protein BJ742DRAFT_795377 [Cladochytrium replicatum]